MELWGQSGGCECGELAAFYSKDTGELWQSLEQAMASTMAFVPSAMGLTRESAARAVRRANAAAHVSHEAPCPTCSRGPLNAPVHVIQPRRLIGRGGVAAARLRSDALRPAPPRYCWRRRLWRKG